MRINGKSSGNGVTRKTRKTVKHKNNKTGGKGLKTPLKAPL